MVAEGHTVASLTGGVEGSQRDAVIDSFRSGEAKVLITTNVLARGIDVSTVSLVVNYVSPSVASPKKLKLRLSAGYPRGVHRRQAHPHTRFPNLPSPYRSYWSIWPHRSRHLIRCKPRRMGHARQDPGSFPLQH
jgi:hypothetical protein